MAGVPKAKATTSKRIEPTNFDKKKKSDNVLFSFESIDRNEYFNLDGTYQSWAADLFETMQMISGISITDIYAGKYSENSLDL